MRDKNDAELVRIAKGGAFEAFEELTNRYEGRMYGLAMNILRQREDAEEAVQSAFLNALEHLDGFREEAAFATWLTRIAANEALKILRTRRGVENLPLETVSEKHDDGPLPHPEYIADWKKNPEQMAERREITRILAEEIGSLPEAQRLVFALRDIEGLSVKETAELLGISDGNVKVRLLRARLALRERLTRVFGDEDTRVESAGHAHGAA